MVTRVRVCNYVKFKARWNFPPVLKIVTHTVHAAEILAVLLMLLSVHVTSVLFLIRFNNFAQLWGCNGYMLLLRSAVLMHS